MEQAEAYQQLMRLRKWNAGTLAEKLHINRSAVTRALRLLRLDDDVRDCVDRVPFRRPRLTRLRRPRRRSRRPSPRPRSRASRLATRSPRRKAAKPAKPAPAAAAVPAKPSLQAAAKAAAAAKAGKTEIPPNTWFFTVSDGVTIEARPGTKSTFGVLAVSKRSARPSPRLRPNSTPASPNTERRAESEAP